MPRSLRIIFLIVDVGFIAYWLVTVLRLIPIEYLYKDYENPLLVAWNWSFLPLDLLVSATGLAALGFHRKGYVIWRSLAVLSLGLTSASGLQAIAFWAIRSDFSLFWWLPNLFLLFYPWIYLWAYFFFGDGLSSEVKSNVSPSTNQ